MKNQIKFAVLLASTSFIFSCAKSDKNDLKEAQLCLNTAQASEARDCLQKIASINSPLAYKLRCAGVFISEGYGSANSFISALDSLNGSTGPGGSSPTVGAIAALTFKNNNNADPSDRAHSSAVADEAFTDCSLSDTKIYLQLSSLFKIGTYAANQAYSLNLGTTIDDTQLKAALVALPDATVGSIVVQTYGSTCQDTTNSTDAIKKYCAELGASVAKGGTESQIGNCMKNKLANPSYICPQY